jgi:hypothetical protein
VVQFSSLSLRDCQGQWEWSNSGVGIGLQFAWKGSEVIFEAGDEKTVFKVQQENGTFALRPFEDGKVDTDGGIILNQAGSSSNSLSMEIAGDVSGKNMRWSRVHVDDANTEQHPAKAWPEIDNACSWVIHAANASLGSLTIKDGPDALHDSKGSPYTRWLGEGVVLGEVVRVTVLQIPCEKGAMMPLDIFGADGPVGRRPDMDGPDLSPILSPIQIADQFINTRMLELPLRSQRHAYTQSSLPPPFSPPSFPFYPCPRA